MLANDVQLKAITGSIGTECSNANYDVSAIFCNPQKSFNKIYPFSIIHFFLACKFRDTNFFRSVRTFDSRVSSWYFNWSLLVAFLLSILLNNEIRIFFRGLPSINSLKCKRISSKSYCGNTTLFFRPFFVGHWVEYSSESSA